MEKLPFLPYRTGTPDTGLPRTITHGYKRIKPPYVVIADGPGEPSLDKPLTTAGALDRARAAEAAARKAEAAHDRLRLSLIVMLVYAALATIAPLAFILIFVFFL